jgi:hypothetical protein
MTCKVHSGESIDWVDLDRRSLRQLSKKSTGKYDYWVHHDFGEDWCIVKINSITKYLVYRKRGDSWIRKSATHLLTAYAIIASENKEETK